MNHTTHMNIKHVQVGLMKQNPEKSLISFPQHPGAITKEGPNFSPAFPNHSLHSGY